MSDFTFEQKNIFALRHAVQLIVSVLSDTQKEELSALLDAPKESMKGIIPDEEIDETYELVQMSREIIRL